MVDGRLQRRLADSVKTDDGKLASNDVREYYTRNKEEQHFFYARVVPGVH